MTGFYTASTVGGTSTCRTGNRFLDPATGDPVVAGTGGFPLGRAVAGGLVATTAYACGASNGELQVTGSYGGEAVQWRAPLDGGLFTQPPIAAGDRVVTSDRGGLHGFAAGGCGGPTDCPPLWTNQAPYNEPAATPTGPIWAWLGSSAVGLDRNTGERVATLVLGDGTDPNTSAEGLAVDGSQVYVSSRSGATGHVALDAFRASCRSGCTSRWRGEATGVSISRPVIGGGVAYVLVADDYDGTNARVLAFAARGCGAATCDPLAAVPVPNRGELSLSDGRLFLSGGDTVTAMAPAATP
jgi:hypothetical protein